MQYKILGTTMPVLEISLEAEEKIVAESGELGWMSRSVQLRTSTQMGGARGILGALRHAATGGTLFMTEYTAHGQPGRVAFPTKVPGQILPLELQAGDAYMAHRSGFLCGTPGVKVAMGFQRSLGRGIFSRMGFLLQELTGPGQAFVELSGEVVSYDLEAGETLQVEPGHVGMFEKRVQFDIVTLKGIRNVLFGGEDLFMVSLTGPGRVWLQSLPLPALAHAIEPYLPPPVEPGN